MPTTPGAAVEQYHRRRPPAPPPPRKTRGTYTARTVRNTCTPPPAPASKPPTRRGALPVVTGARDMPRRYQVDHDRLIREHSRQFCDAIARLQHALEEDELVAWHARHGGGAAHVARRGGAPITRSTTKMSLGGAGIAPGKGNSIRNQMEQARPGRLRHDRRQAQGPHPERPAPNRARKPCRPRRPAANAAIPTQAQNSAGTTALPNQLFVATAMVRLTNMTRYHYSRPSGGGASSRMTAGGGAPVTTASNSPHGAGHTQMAAAASPAAAAVSVAAKTVSQSHGHGGGRNDRHDDVPPPLPLRSVPR